MAFNWDKLCKAQRDYPKPKFALDAISRHLKKRPNDPYVLAWKAHVLLLHDVDASHVLGILRPLCKRVPPITDLPLLSYMYKDILEATRRSASPDFQLLPSAGSDVIDSWQSAAKALTSRKARLELWSELFVCAMREDCWEDVRSAIIQANKEGPKSKKVAYYALILANQLAAERKIDLEKTTGKADPGTKVQFLLALKQIEAMYDSSSKPADEALRIKDMRDLRFMAAIYKRQNQCAKLFKLWEQPPPLLKETMDKFRIDLTNLKVEIARDCKDWSLLEKVCLETIDEALDVAETSKSSQALIEMCSQSWSVWSGLLDASSNLHPVPEMTARVEGLLSRFVRLQNPLESRQLGLTQIALTSYIRQSLLPLVKEYWLHYFQTHTCFQDLRRVIGGLSTDEQKDFHSYITQTARSLTPNSEDISKEAMSTWLHAEHSVLSFEYVLLVSMVEHPDPTFLEDLVANALRLYRTALRAQNHSLLLGLAFIAIATLLRLHKIDSRMDRYLLQAGLFARHLFSDQLFKENARPLALVSTRLHLNLGLGSIAFQHYTYTKIKEMLHDTCSWILLSRISQSHPFDLKGGPKAFSADAELEKVITTLDRMEARVDDHLYNGMQNFHYDVALELLDLKRKLRGSLTKHMCMAERRRIARLKGEAVDLTLEVENKSCIDISDNRDLTALPNLDFSQENSLFSLLMSDCPVTPRSLASIRMTLENTSRRVNKEPVRVGVQTAAFKEIDRIRHETENKETFLTSIEMELERIWIPMMLISIQVTSPATSYEGSLQTDLSVLIARLNEHIKTVKSTNTVDVQQPLWTEDDLQFVYGLLEVSRVLYRLTDSLRTITKQKSHALHSQVPKVTVELLQNTVQLLYSSLMEMTLKGMARLLDEQQEGAPSVRKIATFGKTGEALRDMIGNDNVSVYAYEYVESSIAALNGVRQVKLE